jgi:hypothetical protein
MISWQGNPVEGEGAPKGQRRGQTSPQPRERREGQWTPHLRRYANSIPSSPVGTEMFRSARASVCGKGGKNRMGACTTPKSLGSKGRRPSRCGSVARDPGRPLWPEGGPLREENKVAWLFRITGPPVLRDPLPWPIPSLMLSLDSAPPPPPPPGPPVQRTAAGEATCTRWREKERVE